jgi:hypothetical protein
MSTRLYSGNTLLERLSPDLEAMARARRPLIHQPEAMVREQHLPRQGYLDTADHVHRGDGGVGGLERAGGDDGGAPTRQASDAREAGGLQRFRQAHRRQHGGKAARQHRRARPGGPSI